MRFEVSYSNESITGWVLMVFGFVLFAVCIVIGGYRFFSGYTEQIAEWIQFLTAEDVDNLSIALAFFGGIAGLSLKYYMLAPRKGLLTLNQMGLSIKKESNHIIAPTGNWKIIIYKRSKPFISGALKGEIINRETSAKLIYKRRRKAFKFNIILTSAKEYKLFYSCIAKIERHVHIRVPKTTQ